jgi:hypothetical protein
VARHFGLSPRASHADIEVIWVDHHREPQCAPDPHCPRGVSIDVSGGKPSCMTELGYPAPRCGVYLVQCRRCGANAAVTTAGRTDDPRSIKLPCADPWPMQ